MRQLTPWLALIWAILVVFLSRSILTPQPKPKAYIYEAAEAPNAEEEIQVLPRLQQLVEGVGPEKLAPANLSIVGYVLSDQGKPIEGVQVSARPVSGRSEVTAEGLQKKVRSLRLQQHYSVKTETDSSGRFEFACCANLSYRIQATKAGVEIAGVRATPASVVVMHAEVKKSITFDIRRPDGSSPDFAKIKLMSRNTSSNHNWTPEKNSVDVGRVTASELIQVTADNAYSCDLTVGDLDGAALLGNTKKPIVLNLKRTGAIRVQIISPVGGLKSPNVYALRIDAARPPRPSAALRGRAIGDGFSQSGPMILDNVPPGQYLVAVGSGFNNSKVWAHEIVSVDNNIADVEFDLSEPDSEDCVLIRVVDSGGEVIKSGLSFSRRIEVGGGYSSGGVSSSALGSDGVYRISLGSAVELERALHPEATFTLTVKSSELGEIKQVIRTDTPQPVEFRFGDQSMVTVTLMGAADSFEKVNVQLVTPGAKSEQQHRRYRKNKEELEKRLLGIVQAGEYELVATVNLGEWVVMEVARSAVNIGPGEQYLRIQVPRLYPVTIRGMETKPAKFKNGESGSEQHLFGINAKKDIFMPAGDYYFQFFGDREWKLLSVPGNRAIDMEAK